MPQSRPTIIDIARILGVSHSTVSRAFTSPHRLRPETVERVRSVAAELGYTPNRSAQALSTGRPGVIGMIVPDITNPFFPPMIRAAQRSAERRGISIYVGESDNDPERELSLLRRFERQVEGFVIASSRLSDVALESVAAQTRSVLINRDLDGTARILLSAGSALRHAIEDFSDRGHGSVVYVGGPHRSWSEGERRRAIEDTCATRSLELTVHSCEEGTYREARRIGRSLRIAPGDFLIAFDDVIAHGLFDAISARGLRVPRDVTVLGCDGALPVETSPQLPTISLSTGDAGRRAVDMLLEDASPDRIELDGHLIGWPTSIP